MTSKLTRAQQLIALAVCDTTPQEEARTAAMVAVKLISENDLLAAPRPEQDLRKWFDDMMWSVRGQAVDVDVPPPAPAPTPSPKGKNMKAKFKGTCVSCGKTVAKGEPIVWSKRGGTRHQGCS